MGEWDQRLREGYKAAAEDYGDEHNDPEHREVMRRAADLKDHASPLGTFARTIESLQGALDLMWLNKVHFGVGCFCTWQHVGGEKLLLHECIECATRRQVGAFVTENWSKE